MKLFNVELTEYQKQLIKENGGKFATKTVLITAFFDIVTLVCCYAVCTDYKTIANWAGFFLTLYVFLEWVGVVVFSLALVVAKLSKLVTHIGFSITDKLGEEEPTESKISLDKFFQRSYKLLFCGMSLTFFAVDLIIDIGVFGVFVSLGWFSTSIFHAVAVSLQQVIKRKFYNEIIQHLKNESPPETNETTDELMDKLIYGEEKENGD